VTSEPSHPLVPPFTLELDDAGPVLLHDAAQAMAMASAYLELSPPNAVALLTDAIGRTVTMKTNDAGEVIDVPF
jgi:hypothetical protein